MIEFHVPPEEYARRVKSQRNVCHNVAGKLFRGETLNKQEIELTALILIQWAADLKDTKPRNVGKAPVIEPGVAACDYAVLVLCKGVSKAKAIAALAEHWNVTVEAMRKALKKHKDEAFQMIEESGLAKRDPAGITHKDEALDEAFQAIEARANSMLSRPPLGTKTKHSRQSRRVRTIGT